MAELKTLSNKLLTGQAIRVAVLVTSSVATSFIIPSAPFSLAITGGIFITVNYDYQLVAVAQ